MNNKTNKKRSAKNGRGRNSQKGVLLIGLIITMVILSVLGGAMVYIFSSSTLNPVSGNYAQQAYYNAEAGFRYVTALYRSTGQKTVLDPYIAAAQTISLPNSGTAKVSVTTPTTSASATATFTGGNLVLSGVSGTIPPSPGFFTKDSGATVYRYTGKSTDGSGVITLSGITPTITAGGSITTKETTTITSVGTFGSGFWNVSRTVTYAWALSGAPSGSGEGPPSAVPSSTIAGGTGNSTGTFTPGNYYGNEGAVKVTGVHGNVDNPQSYPEAYGAPAWATNPFCQPWSNAGNYLSYDVQAKVSEEHNTAPDWWVSGTTYHLDDVVRATLNDGNTYDLICQQTTCTTLPRRTWFGWQMNGWSNVLFVYNLGMLFRMSDLDPQTNAYGLTFFRSTRLDSMSGAPLDGVDATMMPTNLGDNEPAILLFTRDGGANDGEKSKWLAYMTLSGSNFVVDAEDFLKRWNTLVVRIIEGASIKLSATSAPDINIGDQITGGSGSAKIVRKINDSDGRVVLILNNVSGSFTSPVTVNGTSYAMYNGWGDAAAVPAWQDNTLYHVGDWVQRLGATYMCIQEHTSKNSNPGRIRPPNSTYWVVDTPPSFYRSRDNYIWAFFADTDNHTTYDSTATNNTRREKDLFPNDLTGFLPPFPVTDIQAWEAASDDFTLVTWNSSLNTSVDSSLRRLGTGKEQNAIIRTNRWVTGSYPTSCSSFPEEIGIVAKGTVSMQFAYDDLAYRILWGVGGSTTYIPPVQQ